MSPTPEQRRMMLQLRADFTARMRQFDVDRTELLGQLQQVGPKSWVVG